VVAICVGAVVRRIVPVRPVLVRLAQVGINRKLLI
jgi:hypothetical protein